MNETAAREARAQRIYRAFVMFYILFNIVLLVIYIMKRDSYHLSVTLGTFAIPLALMLIWKIPVLHRVYQLDILILGFTFLAYPLGSCLDLYLLIPGFDKVAHTLSGTFTAQLALILYYALKPGHRIERKDTALALTYMFFASVAVAGMWEIGEFLLSGIMGRDLQRVELTGVTDSMMDMIVCTIGTLILIPIVIKLCRGKSGLITNTIRDTIALNFPGSQD